MQQILKSTWFFFMIIILILLQVIFQHCNNSDSPVNPTNSINKTGAGEIDENCDGTIDLCQSMTYDMNDNQLTLNIDEGCDGTIDICRTTTYDTEGERLTLNVDEGCDGNSLDDKCYKYTKLTLKLQLI